MRVVAGTAGGLRLRSPAGRSLRPTTERVREAVFSSLTSHGLLEGARVLDLFAGTGALGIEALSRGAASATFVESDPVAVATIKANLEATGLAPAATVVHADARRFVAGADPRSEGAARAPGARAGDDPFDLAFADPPYRFTEWPELLAHLPARVAVLESRHAVEPGPEWVTMSTRRHGDTVVTFARRNGGSQ